jgi:hypothetical protein
VSKSSQGGYQIERKCLKENVWWASPFGAMYLFLITNDGTVTQVRGNFAAKHKSSSHQADH